MNNHTDLLVSQGYKLIEDAWGQYGRRTYLHDDDATRAHITNLARNLKCAGWEINRERLRSFNHCQTGEFIEIEPGGSETTGHFLHHMKVSE
jgi:hypothetical protein